ncbi:hypothetical protein D3C73_1667230 [compost metagenome]
MLTGFETEDGITYADDVEKKSVKVYRELNDYDKKEIIEMIELKKRLRASLLS